MNNSKFELFTIPRLPNSENADSVSIQHFDQHSFCIALADGVGKNTYSSDASKKATEIATSMPIGTDINDIFRIAREALINGALATNNEVWSTTLTVCRVIDYQASLGHVGDSRLYHLRGNGIITRTHDQTELQALIDEGVLSKERAKKYPRRNILLSALSSESEYNLMTSTFDVKLGDRLLLISDGVYKQLQRKEIVNISINSLTTEKFMSELYNLLLSRGIVDDSTAACVEIA